MKVTPVVKECHKYYSSWQKYRNRGHGDVVDKNTKGNRRSDNDHDEM